MRLLQSFLQGIIVSILPLFIVAFSIAFVLPNGDVHKDSLKTENFYVKLNDELKKNYANAPDSNNVLGYLIIGPVVDKLVTPDWLKDVTETNIDYVTRWLKGDSNVLNFYLPTSDIEKVVREGVNNQTEKLVKSDSTNLKVCSEEDLAKLKAEGYDSSQPFCIPKEVKEGTKKLSDVLGISQQSGFNSLDSLIKNNPVSSLSNQVNAQSIISGANQTTLSRLNWVRDQLIYFRSRVVIIFVFFLVLIAIDIALVAMANRKIITYLRRISWFISTSTLSLCLFWLLLTGGSVYLTSNLNQLLLPGFASSEMVNLLIWNLVRLSFNLIFPALVVSGVLLFINIVALVLEKFGVLDGAKFKNQKLAIKPANVVLNSNNPTLDGQFKTMLNKSDEVLKENPALVFPKSSELESAQNDFSMDNYPRNSSSINQSEELKNNLNQNTPLTFSSQNTPNQAIDTNLFNSENRIGFDQNQSGESTSTSNTNNSTVVNQTEIQPNVVETDTTVKRFLG